jgi:hypothetical protein
LAGKVPFRTELGVVDPGAVGGDDLLGDGVLVFAQGSGDTGKRWQSAVGDLLEPGRQGCRIAVVEHACELADQVVGALEFRTVSKEPVQAGTISRLRRSG